MADNTITVDGPAGKFTIRYTGTRPSNDEVAEAYETHARSKKTAPAVPAAPKKQTGAGGIGYSMRPAVPQAIQGQGQRQEQFGVRVIDPKLYQEYLASPAGQALESAREAQQMRPAVPLREPSSGKLMASGMTALLPGATALGASGAAGNLAARAGLSPMLTAITRGGAAIGGAMLGGAGKEAADRIVQGKTDYENNQKARSVIAQQYPYAQVAIDTVPNLIFGAGIGNRAADLFPAAGLGFGQNTFEQYNAYLNNPEDTRSFAEAYQPGVALAAGAANLLGSRNTRAGDVAENFGADLAGNVASRFPARGIADPLSIDPAPASLPQTNADVIGGASRSLADQAGLNADGSLKDLMIYDRAPADVKGRVDKDGISGAEKIGDRIYDPETKTVSTITRFEPDGSAFTVPDKVDARGNVVRATPSTDSGADNSAGLAPAETKLRPMDPRPARSVPVPVPDGSVSNGPDGLDGGFSTVGIRDRAGMSDALQKQFGYDKPTADSTAAIADARAKSWAKSTGKTPGEWYNSRIAGLTKGELQPGQLKESLSVPETADALNQSAAKPTVKTDTPEFKRFFEGSKVVNEAGEPLVVYHGTPESGFTEVNTSASKSKKTAYQLMVGAHFTENPEFADLYTQKAKGAVGTSRMSSGMTGGGVYPTYLAIKTPLDVATASLFPKGSTEWNLWQSLPASVRSKFNYQTGVATIKDGYKFDGEYVSSGGIEQALDSMGPQKARELIEAAGFDGVIYNANYNAGRPGTKKLDKSYIAFKPEQIKSSIGNRGTFDPTDPNILNQSEQSGTSSVDSPRASVEFLESNKSVLRALGSPDASSAVHELAHVFRRDLYKDAGTNGFTPDDITSVEQWAGVSEGKWDRPAEEKFAVAFEGYLQTGKAPTKPLEKVFAYLKTAISNVYAAVRGTASDPATVEISPEVRDVFDRLLGGGGKDVPVAADTVEPSSKPVRAGSIRIADLEARAEALGIPIADRAEWTRTQKDVAEKANANAAGNLTRLLSADVSKGDRLTPEEQFIGGQRLQQLEDTELPALLAQIDKATADGDELGILKARAAFDAAINQYGDINGKLVREGSEAGRALALRKMFVDKGDFDAGQIIAQMEKVTSKPLSADAKLTITRQAAKGKLIEKNLTSRVTERAAQAEKRIKAGSNNFATSAKPDRSALVEQVRRAARGASDTGPDTLNQGSLKNLSGNEGKTSSIKKPDKPLPYEPDSDETFLFVKDIVSKSYDAYEYPAYGIRVLSIVDDGDLNLPPPSLGGTLDDSQVWDDGDPTGEYLDGVSTAEIDPERIDSTLRTALRNSKNYYGKYVVLVGGEQGGYGEDAGELIIKNPSVLHVWDNLPDKPKTSEKASSTPGAAEISAAPGVLKGGTNLLYQSTAPVSLREALVPLGAYHVEAGTRKYESWAKVMREDMGTDASAKISDKDLQSLWVESRKVVPAEVRRAESTVSRAAGKRLSNLENNFPKQTPSFNEDLVSVGVREYANGARDLAAFSRKMKAAVGNLVDDATLQQTFTEAAQQYKTDYRALESVKKAIGNTLQAEAYKNLSPLAKLYGGSVDVVNAGRALTTSFDLSAPFRQGGFLTLANPRMASKSFAPMIQAFAREDVAQAVDAAIRTRPNASDYDRAKLNLSSLDDEVDFTAPEELFRGKLAEKIPGVGRIVRSSERAYVTYLNKLRADCFDALSRSITGNGSRALTDNEAQSLGNFINVATGRGQGPVSDAVAKAMNGILFSPRYTVSRFQLVTGQPLLASRDSRAAQKLIARTYLQYAGSVATILGMAELSREFGTDVDIEKDPRSANFGKIRVGGVQIDIHGGLQQVITYTARMLANESKGQDGAIRPVSGMDTTTRLIRGKLSPAAGSIADVMARDEKAPYGKNFIGESVAGEDNNPWAAVRYYLGKNVAPMSLADFYSTAQESGVPRAAVTTLLAGFGFGIRNLKDEDRDAMRGSTATPSLRDSPLPGTKGIVDVLERGGILK